MRVRYRPVRDRGFSIATPSLALATRAAARRACVRRWFAAFASVRRSRFISFRRRWLPRFDMARRGLPSLRPPVPELPLAPSALAFDLLAGADRLQDDSLRSGHVVGLSDVEAFEPTRRSSLW